MKNLKISLGRMVLFIIILITLNACHKKDSITVLSGVLPTTHNEAITLVNCKNYFPGFVNGRKIAETNTDNVNWVKELGADRVIDYKTEDYKTIIKNADIVFDTLGDNYTLEAFDLIKQGGKVVSVKGVLDEETAKMFGMADYKLPEELAKLISDKDATYKYIFMHPNGVHLNEIKLLVEDEKIKPIIDKVYSFSDSIEAFTHLATGRAKGKIVIAMNS